MEPRSTTTTAWRFLPVAILPQTSRVLLKVAIKPGFEGIRERVMYQFSWSPSLDCVNANRFTRPSN
jgi:hypothetical protein